VLNIGPFEIILILVIALLVIGPDGLPDAVRKVARFFGELRRYGEEVQEEVRAIIDEAASTVDDEPANVEGNQRSDV
jgi:sec-independent protein translocase protein TatB